ncbi:uncharacterized protein KY384_001863 [Bacidia gigantensis]|uniref:uncharacterized protein n=1 Tax=Bacidia gigantensis TaxID=2732470 RepID=UPI001D057EF5|nr:uncharacterized protein KY384_001863 [Bacidia gigantensis]KAG8533080.1 hypothetical protein KY384_001863 [Bacidia gigantensis]
MGVTGLWTVVQPCARPIKLETLNRKRLAIDASIWIYQFLKAVRDKEGNALRNSHVVGFFRRICKLLFFGIKPVFVFDGGAPVLKRQTVSSRKSRREGRREDAVRTAGKLLAVQMQRRAEEEEQRRKDERDQPRQDEEEEEVPENPVYVDEIQMTAQERQQNRAFRKKDAYHLPNLDADLSGMGAPNDPRIMSHEELEEYARQFHTGEDVNLYDFSKIDFEGPFFQSLPASDRYNILNAARLRSRLRMGYSKEQLDTMFPNRMDFSRFQIDRVKERNELTQRLMNINGMNGEEAMFGVDQGGRVAGEKGKEYVLVKNDGVEGGWALGVVSNKGEGERSKPIDVDVSTQRDPKQDENEEEWEADGFEDVPIEGLNRLSKRQARQAPEENLLFSSEEAAARRRKLYGARMKNARPMSRDQDERIVPEESDSLFIPQAEQRDEDDEEIDELFEDVPAPAVEGEDDDLNRAIAMSLENDQADKSDEEQELPSFASTVKSGPRTDQLLEFNQKNASAGRDFAHLANARAHGLAPKAAEDESDEDDFNIRAGLTEARNGKHRPQTGPRVHGFKRPEPSKNLEQSPSGLRRGEDAPSASNESTANLNGFDGPLPFESLSLGKSILGKKKKKPADKAQGGFEKDSMSEEKAPKPLPPWFSGDIRKETAKQDALEEQEFQKEDASPQRNTAVDLPVLRHQETGEIIDLDHPQGQNDEVVLVPSDDEDGSDDMFMGESRPIQEDLIMDDIADLTCIEPPITYVGAHKPPPPASPIETAIDRQTIDRSDAGSTPAEDTSARKGPSESLVPSPREKAPGSDHGDDDVDQSPIDWSESDHETEQPRKQNLKTSEEPAGGTLEQKVNDPSKSSSLELADQGVNEVDSQPSDRAESTFQDADVDQSRPALIKEESMTIPTFEGLDATADDDDYSDPEDEDLMRQLAGEAEEHARFASELNQKTFLQNAEDYERELRQLRNQQKKDRRDADEVSHIMVTECQQLLKLFGLPYITAPMEAEAQCATLVSLGLVDGIVTDDSDIFLFGGTRVYKNMFNQAKFVECYLSTDLEKEYSLTRDKLIRFAHLLGSDYTEGLPNVGPVTALEILSEFETLENFAEWWAAVQMTQRPAEEDKGSAFRRKFRKNASKIFLPNTFPDTRVDQAYLYPEVDKDPQPFQWGAPDLDALRNFLMATIGWGQERTDEVLVPVIKDINRRENEGTQANITQFFGGGVGVGARQNVNTGGGGGGQAFAPRKKVGGKSKRMESALESLAGRAKGRAAGDGDGDGDGGSAKGGEDGVVGSKRAAERGNGSGGGRKKRKARAEKRVVTSDEENEENMEIGSDDEDTDGGAAYKAPARTKRGRLKAS